MDKVEKKVSDKVWHRFASVKLWHKFYGFSGALIVSILFIGVVSIIIMEELNSGTTDVSEDWMPSVIVAEELNTATSDFRIAEISHVVSQDKGTMETHEITLKTISNEIDKMFLEYEKSLITNPEDASLIAQAHTLWEEYLVIHEDMITHSRDNDTEAAMNIMSNESERLFVKVSNVFLELVEFNKEGADQASLTGDSIFVSSIAVIGAVFALSFFIFYMFRSLMLDVEATQAKLEIAHEEALLSSQAKSNFLANMSHEIRTPMNAISGMTDIILRETTDSDVSEYANAIKRACDSLLSIINDVLDISKIESGKLEIVESEYTLSTVLSDVLTIATNRIEHKNLMFITDFQHDIPDNLIGDEVRIKQIMVNILNNAIKFTHDGHVAFHIHGSVEGNNLQLKIAVSDTGVGISKEDMDKLFVEFERVNTKKNRAIEGTGLGLAISKRLSEMMGGTIEVESELGRGTTFSVIINQRFEDSTPMAQVEEKKSVLIFESRELYLQSIADACKQLSLDQVVCCSSQSELNESLGTAKFDYIFASAMYHNKLQEIVKKQNLETKIVLLADNADIKMKYDHTTILLPAHTISIANVLNGKTMVGVNNQNHTQFVAPNSHILVVDDNLVNVKVAQGLLKPYLCKIDTAENGQEAVNKIRKNHYDMVFMDHMMPIMDGIDATIAVRGTEGDYFQSLPIVALTANALVGTEEMFLKEGMNDFLAKPIKLEALNEVLAKWLPKEMQMPLEDFNTTQNSSENRSIEDPGKSTSRLAIDKVDTELGIKRIGGDFESYITILDLFYKDGVKRISILQDYLDAKHYQEYKVEVHALKSACASVGATGVSTKAQKLEEACNGENFSYVDQNSPEFVQEFKELLENIQNALSEMIVEGEPSDKDHGDETLYKESLHKLKEALDDVDINSCNEILTKLSEYQWSKTIQDHISQIKDNVSVYEYDEAIEFIEAILGK
ncbi:MAG: ATP-binding protein [Eubacteriales bacterium]